MKRWDDVHSSPPLSRPLVFNGTKKTADSSFKRECRNFRRPSRPARCRRGCSRSPRCSSRGGPRRASCSTTSPTSDGPTADDDSEKSLPEVEAEGERWCQEWWEVVVAKWQNLVVKRCWRVATAGRCFRLIPSWRRCRTSSVEVVVVKKRRSSALMSTCSLKSKMLTSSF